jgi:hypothetical protein
MRKFDIANFSMFLKALDAMGGKKKGAGCGGDVQ